MLLTPYRVLDLTRTYGMLCGQMLADLGADVIQIEPPGGADGRRLGPYLNHTPDPESSLYWWGYSRGKRSVILDLEAQAEHFAQLVASADILIESEPMDGQPALPLDYESLAAIHPGLIYVKISPYGASGPKAGWSASDITIAASAGPLAMTGDDDRAPVRVSIPQSYNHAAAEAAVGALVALHERHKSGRGQRVDASAQQAMTLATQGNILASAVGETVAQRTAGGLKAGELRLRLTYPAKDGFVSITHIFGATVGPATARLMEYVYENGFCDKATCDKDWVAYGLLLSTGEEPIAEFERVKECVAACTASKTKAELLEVAMERRLLLAPMTTIADVVDAEQFAEREYFVRPQGTGSSVQANYPGPFARFSRTPMTTPSAPPRAGQHTEEVLAELATRTAAPPPTAGTGAGPEADQLPLAGLKVLDFMWALAGPGCTRTLADWGATIIRVESSSKLDAIRTVRPFMEGDESPDKSALFHTTNAGKRLVTLNLNTPEGISVIKDLVGWADLVAESFSPKAMKNFGLDYATLKTIKPDLIMLSTCLMGQTGPLSMFAGYGNLAAAIAGFYDITGWEDRDPAGPFGAYTDYIAPKFNAAAVLAALDHRRRTGEGQHIDLAQAEAAMHFLTPAILDYTFNGHMHTRTGNRDLNFAPHGVYPTAGDDEHIAIACETDTQWQALQGAIKSLGTMTDVQTCAQRHAAADAIDAAIVQFCAKQDAHALTESLQALGVPSSPVLNGEALVADPQLQHLGHFIELPHHEGGHTAIEASRFALSRSPGVCDTTAPTFNRDMDFVLKEVLGYDDEKLGELLIAGALE